MSLLFPIDLEPRRRMVDASGDGEISNTLPGQQRSTPIMTFHYTDWFIGILFWLVRNPYLIAHLLVI